MKYHCWLCNNGTVTETREKNVKMPLLLGLGATILPEALVGRCDSCHAVLYAIQPPGDVNKQIIPVVAACITRRKGNKGVREFLLHMKDEAVDEEGVPRNPELVGKWEFAGGMMKYGKAPEVALKREVKEELDAFISVGRLVHAKTFMGADKVHYLVLYYDCLLVGKNTKGTWFPATEFPDNSLPEVKEAAGYYQALDQFAAQQFRPAYHAGENS